MIEIRALHRRRGPRIDQVDAFSRLFYVPVLLNEKRDLVLADALFEHLGGRRLGVVWVRKSCVESLGHENAPED